MIKLTREEEAPLHTECMEIMAILKSKILDLERLERDSSTRIREPREAYTFSTTLDEQSFPFTADDYE